MYKGTCYYLGAFVIVVLQLIGAFVMEVLQLIGAFVMEVLQLIFSQHAIVPLTDVFCA